MENQLRVNLITVASILLTILLTSCSLEQDSSQIDLSADQYARPEPPPEYKGVKFPDQTKESFIASGGKTYQFNCESCHGENGAGNGVLAASLDKKPVPFNFDEVEDSYLFWRISEGGMMDPFNSVMPAWKSILSEQQIWEVIAFLRTLPE